MKATLMLPVGVVHDQVLETAGKRLGQDKLHGVSVEETFDADGSDALRITVKLKKNTARLIKGDTVLDLLVEIRRELSESGENRLPIVEYEEEGEESESQA